MADVNVTATSPISLWYVGDTAVTAIPCTVTDMIDQGVIIADGKFSAEEAWEGAGAIISPAIPAGTKKTYAFSDPELAPRDSRYDGTLEVDFTATPKTAHVTITSCPDCVDVSATSPISLWYVGDTAVTAVPCTVTDMIDQGVIIADGRFSDEEAWEGAGAIISPAIPAGTKNTYAFSDADLAPWNTQYDGTLEVDFTASPKTALITITKYPEGGFPVPDDPLPEGQYTVLQPVVSSNLRAVGWGTLFATPVLEVAFRSGSLYIYRGVPEAVFDALMAAPSKGQYFWQHIRCKTQACTGGDIPYPYHKLR